MSSPPPMLNTAASLGSRPGRTFGRQVTCQHASVQQRLPSLIVPPIGFAHRGARAHARENTLEAFQLALRLGATGLESDVWLTADGIPVLDHDGTLGGIGRVLRRNRVAGRDQRDLPEHIPTLAQLLDACGADYHLALDLKDPAAARPVVQTVEDVAPALLPRLWLCHPDWQLLAELRSLHPDVKLVDSTRLNKIKEGPERRAATLGEHGIDAINLHHTDWTGGLTTLFHRFERFTLAWDLQYEHVLREVLRMGIDGVFSDWVDRMLDALRAERS
jgi:glycerophosphoryl diester phosphodiesterase